MEPVVAAQPALALALLETVVQDRGSLSGGTTGIWEDRA
jgi:hypothetical protein